MQLPRNIETSPWSKTETPTREYFLLTLIWKPDSAKQLSQFRSENRLQWSMETSQDQTVESILIDSYGNYLHHEIPKGGTIPCSSLACPPSRYDTLKRILMEFPFPASTFSICISCLTPTDCRGEMSLPLWGLSLRWYACKNSSVSYPCLWERKDKILPVQRQLGNEAPSMAESSYSRTEP